MKQRYVDAPMGSGVCAKQVVTATLVDADGNHYVSTNYCMSPQTSCPRGGLPSGVGYQLCKDICKQTLHAETGAIALAASISKESVAGSTIYLQGHTFACNNCSSVSKQVGVEIVVMAPPEFNL